MKAAWNGHTEVVEKLLDRGANKEAKDAEGTNNENSCSNTA